MTLVLNLLANFFLGLFLYFSQPVLSAFVKRPKFGKKRVCPAEEEVLFRDVPTGIGYEGGKISKSAYRCWSPGPYGAYTYIPPDAKWGVLGFGWDIVGPIEITYYWNHQSTVTHFAGEIVKPLPGARVSKCVPLGTIQHASDLFWRDYLRAHGETV